MIKYNLICKCNCTFDSWFASSEEFGRLIKRKLITCIECNSNNVNKSIMAPNVSSSKKIDNIILGKITCINSKITSAHI